MKKLKYIVLLLFIILMCSCSNDGDYTFVIPEDAEAVVEIDANVLMQETDGTNSNRWNGLEKGVELSTPIYVFKTKDALVATLKVKDETELTEVLSRLSKKGVCSKPTSKDGMWIGTLLGNVHFGYDEEKIVIYYNIGSTHLPVRRAIAQLMDNTDAPFVNTEQYTKLKQEKGDIKLFAKNDEAETFGGVRIEKGKTTITANLTPNNTYKGTKGEVLLNVIKSIPLLQGYLRIIEMGMDAEMIMRSMDYGIRIGIKEKNMTSIPEFFVSAHVNNEDYKTDMNGWREEMRNYGFDLTMNIENHMVFVGNTLAWDLKEDNDIVIEINTNDKDTLPIKLLNLLHI